MSGDGSTLENSIGYQATLVFPTRVLCETQGEYEPFLVAQSDTDSIMRILSRIPSPFRPLNQSTELSHSLRISDYFTTYRIVPQFALLEHDPFLRTVVMMYCKGEGSDVKNMAQNCVVKPNFSGEYGFGIFPANREIFRMLYESSIERSEKTKRPVLVSY